jgi:diguanylate cyclase (GGDEF)-like protein
MLELLQLPVPTTTDAIAELQTIAYTDGLTSLPNRRSFDLYLPRICEREGFAVLFVDFDDLKKANRELGHLTANAMLAEAGRVLRQHMRRSRDIAFRFGGDELIAVLDGADLAYASAIAESIRKAVASIDRFEYKCSVSIGVVACPHQPESWEAIVNRADRLMAIAKSRGKNAVAVG